MATVTRLVAGLRRAWDETVAPPVFGEEPALRRLWRIRLRSAFVLAVPAHLFLIFYLGQAVSAHLRTVRGTGDAEPLTLELLQLHLHDRLRHDTHHLLAGSGRASPKLEQIALRLRNDDLDRLDAELPPKDGAVGYVPGELEHRGNTYDVELRYRGSRHWNWNYPQKSWRVRFGKDRHLLGHDVLLLTNSPEPEPELELATLELARRRGLMVPHFEPVWLEENGAPMGVYFLEAPVDESVLRHAHRFPWNVYSGDDAPVDPVTHTSRLFESVEYWSKVAGPIGQEQDFSELAELLGALRTADQRAFARFADERLDQRAFADLDAIDVVLGIDQHNYDQNQKIYYDPYRGTFEPIAWNLRGGNHEPVVQRAPSPLVLRLSELPAFADLRDATAWTLLHGEASPDALAAALRAWDGRLVDAFDQDPYWDAVNLLPQLGPYFEEMARPMDRAKQLEAREVELSRIRERNGFLLRELAQSTFRAELFLPPALGAVAGAPVVPADAPAPRVGLLRLEVGGRAPVDLLSLEVGSASGCRPTVVRWRRRAPRGGPEDEWQTVAPGGALSTPERLFPGTVRVARPATVTRGRVRLAPDARRYDLELELGPCAPDSVRLGLRNVRTQEETARRVAGHTGEAPGPETCEVAFEAGPGGRAMHPWCLGRRPKRQEVRLGPGEVQITETRRYGADRHLVIEPGTTLRMGPGTSLFARGTLTARGRRDAPIRFVGQGWGTVAIDGRDAAGSTLEHVEFLGGSEGRAEGRHYTAMLSVHDTSRFSLRDARLSGARGEDALHLVYVRDADLSRVTILNARSDAVDLEHSRVELHGLTVLGAGDDALDLMGSRVHAEGMNLLDCTDNGVSAGEETEITISDAVITRCPVGILAKNASRVRVSNVAVAAARTGIRVERRSDYYVGESSASGSGLWFLAVDDPRRLVDKPRFDVERTGEPTAADLARLLLPRGLGQPAELLQWRGPRQVPP